MDAHQAGLATKFVVPICLDLAGPVGFPVEALSHWLRKTAKLIARRKKFGCGPVPGSYVECRIGHDELTETTAELSSPPPPDKMSDSKPYVMSLITFGPPEFPRYALADQWNHFWDGKHRGKRGDHRAALLFADAKQAVEYAQKLLMVDYTNMTMRQFVMPLHISVQGESVSARDLQHWLIRATKLFIHSPKRGNGLLGGAFGICRIDYTDIKTVV
jgi:hypothetical protein